jgi:integrase
MEVQPNPENPVARVSPVQRDQEEVVYLTPEEVGRLNEACKGHYVSNLVEFALLTGVRLGEALGLRWEDVDLIDGTVRIRQQLQRVNNEFVLRPPKSSSGRRNLALVPRAVSLLQDQHANQILWESTSKEDFNALHLVFTGVDGRPLYQKNVDVLLKRFAKQAKIQKSISFHKLRHTLATHAAASGKVSLAALKDQLGHSQISTTINTYRHAVPTALRSLAEIVEASYEPTDKK